MEQKRGEGTQRFLKRGQGGSRGGCLKKGGGLEPPYELCQAVTSYFLKLTLSNQAIFFVYDQTIKTKKLNILRTKTVFKMK